MDVQAKKEWQRIITMWGSVNMDCLQSIKLWYQAIIEKLEIIPSPGL